VFLSMVAASGARVAGIDLSESLLARARERLAAAGNVQLTCGNAEATPFPSECFDAVYGSSVLHHLDLDGALRECHRVLKPGGRIVFAEPNIFNPQVALMFRCRPLHGYFGVSPDEMAFSRFRARRALAGAGFDAATVQPFDFLHPSVPAPLLDGVSAMGRLLERVPLVREISGSMLIVARRPPR
jgi:SAM-dependent methyltransferase